MSVETANNNPLSVLIVGCGNIAGGFDIGRAIHDLPYTHAGAFSRDRRFKITACVEPDEQRRLKFMEYWSISKGVAHLVELLPSAEKYDVISICSPTECHRQDIESALKLKPRLIFCEKPVTTLLAETERCVGECAAVAIPMAVNYTRRWDPDIQKLKSDIQAGQWGKLRSITGLYNKGILNNGSHLMDLLNCLLGKITIVKIGKVVSDYLQSDPSVPVWLESEQGVPIHIACAHAGDYAVFELQFVFSLGVLIMEEGGMFWRERRATDSDTFKGYRKLDQGIRRSGGYPKAMSLAVENIYHMLANATPLASTGESALVAQKLCEAIKRGANDKFTIQ